MEKGALFIEVGYDRETIEELELRLSKIREDLDYIKQNTSKNRAYYTERSKLAAVAIITIIASYSLGSFLCEILATIF